MSAVWDDSALIDAITNALAKCLIDAFNNAMAKYLEKHEVVGESSKTNQRKLETKVAGGHDDHKNSNDSSLQIREEEVRKEQTEDDADISVPPTHEEDADKATVDMKKPPIVNAFNKAMAKYPDPTGLCSKSSGTMSAVCDDSAFINALNKAMANHPEKHEVVGKSSKTNQRKLETKVAGGHDDQKNSNDSSLQIWEEEVRREQTEDDADISVPPTHEEDAEKAAVDMKQHPTINAFNKAMAKDPDPTGLCSKSSGTMSLVWDKSVWDDWGLIDAFNKAMAKYPKHEAVGNSSKTNQRMLETKVAGGHDDHKNSNDSSLQIREEEVRKEQTEDDADISVPPTHEEDADKATVDMKQPPIINAFNKAMAKYPDPTGLCSKSSGTMSLVWDKSAFMDALNKAMAKDPEKHEVVGKSSKTNQRKLETKVAGGHDDQKNSNDSSLQIREEEVRKEQTEDDADISVPPTHEEDADKAGVDMKQPPIINAFNKAMAKDPDPTGLCSKSSGTMSAVWDDSAFVNALNKAMANHPEKHEVVGKSSKTNQRKLETKVAGGHDDHKNSNDSSLQIREEEVRKEQTEDDADISVPPTHEEDADKAAVDMKQHPCQETYSANLEEQQAPTRPIDEVEKAAELEWQPWHQVWQQLQELEQQQNMLYQQLYHLCAYPMGQGTSSLQPSTDNGTTEQLTAAHVDVSNAHYFPYQSAHAQGWASYPSPPFYQACWSCRQPHEPLATAPCLAQYGHDSHLGNPCQVARPPSVKDPAAFATMVATEAVGAVKSGVSVKNASTSGTNPEEEKDGISEMLLAWFQAGYSTARYLERQG
ncbi:hypothetical protein BDL97_05G139400 [Sphagnum fallax]|nr:hypothetical protein BDL97_05G139400 [Sphagnum fallax]